VNSALPPADIRAGLIAYDAVLGLKLAEPDDRAKELIRKEFGEEVASSDIPDHLNELLKEREAARVEKNWAVADAARTKIESEGYVIEDTPEGPRLVKKG
jgi:cysteinyl-tRNA synthetase